MRVKLMIYPVLIFAAAVFTQCSTDPKEVFLKELETVLPEKNSDFDLTETAISLTMLIDRSADRKWMDYQIKKMTTEAAAIIADEGDYEIIIEKLNKYFFKTHGFKFDESYDSPGKQASPDSHSLEKLLKTRRGICMNMSLLYLIIADRLSLPMKGVMIPGHIYVRCVPPGRSGINIETTFSGAQYYGYSSMWSAYMPGEQAAYGVPLGKYEVLGAYLSNISIYFLNSGKVIEAEACAEKSIAMLPGAAEPLLSLAIIKASAGDYASAEKNLLEALAINPDSAHAHLMLGRVYLNQKRKYPAIRSEERRVGA